MVFLIDLNDTRILIGTGGESQLSLRARVTLLEVTKSEGSFKVNNADGTVTSIGLAPGAGLTFTTPRAMNGNLTFPEVKGNLSKMFRSIWVLFKQRSPVYLIMIEETKGISIILLRVTMSGQVRCSGNLHFPIVVSSKNPARLAVSDASGESVNIVHREEDDALIVRSSLDNIPLYFSRYHS